MKLWWVRHAEAEFGTMDKDRNLTNFGKTQAQKLADYLCVSADKPNKIYASSYNRARQTAQFIADKLKLEVIVLSNITPEDSVESALAHLKELDTNSLVVTHQPLWSMTLSKLLQETSSINIPTAGMAILAGDIFIPGALSLIKIITELK